MMIFWSVGSFSELSSQIQCVTSINFPFDDTWLSSLLFSTLILSYFFSLHFFFDDLFSHPLMKMIYCSSHKGMWFSFSPCQDCLLLCVALTMLTMNHPSYLGCIHKEGITREKKRIGTDSSRNQEHFRLWAVSQSWLPELTRKSQKPRNKPRKRCTRTVKRDIVEKYLLIIHLLVVSHP